MIPKEIISAAASSIQAEPAVIRAVIEVESGGSGFLASGKPTILFEGHIFHKYTGGKFTATHPTISYPKWTKQFYKGGEKEWDRFNEAFKLDPNAAQLSTSYGLFQIMGFNYKACNYRTVDEYTRNMAISETKQLQAFISMVQSMGLDSELRNKQWAAFAVRYNGSGYRANKYDEKLAASYAKYSKLDKI